MGFGGFVGCRCGWVFVWVCGGVWVLFGFGVGFGLILCVVCDFWAITFRVGFA